MFGRNSNKGNYAYTATRAKAKKSLLLTEEDYNKMIQMTDPAEISRYISEAGYSKEMIEFGDKYSGIDLVEYATYAYMARNFKAMLTGAQGEPRDVLRAYLEKWDSWNIKSVLRGKSYGLPANEIKSNFVLAGCLSAEDLDKLIAIDSIDDVIASLGKVAGIEIPADVISAYKASENLGVIEDYLDKHRFKKLIGSISATSASGSILLDYVRRVIDIRNLGIIVKLKLDGITGDKVMEYIIPNGKQIDAKLAKTLADMQTVEEVIQSLSQFDMYEYIKETVESTPTVRDISIAIVKYQNMLARKFSEEYPLSILPVVDYMIGAEKEARNIRAIARGIQSGLSKETIKQMLVI